MVERNTIRIRESETYVSGTYAYVRTKVVPPGVRWCLEHIAYENETGARGTFRRYIYRGDYPHFLAEVQGPGAAELMTWDGRLYLMPGDQLVIRQTSCSASDVLSLYADGYEEKL
jgi:hypothetical protein